jgi:hypothetical protein
MEYNKNLTGNVYIYDEMPYRNPESPFYNENLMNQIDKKVEELMKLNLPAEEVIKLLEDERNS